MIGLRPAAAETVKKSGHPGENSIQGITPALGKILQLIADRTAGTLEGGTVRFSASAFNTMGETAALCRALGRGGPPKTAGEKFTIS